MRTAVKWIILGIALFLLPLLTGCSREYRETRRNIDRIYKAAEQSAEKRAAT